MKLSLTGVALLLSAVGSVEAATCEQNVDKVKLFYVNGMFTDYFKFGANKAQLITFQKAHLKNEFELHPIVDGSYNDNEDLIKQFAQVAAQKYADSGPIEREAIKKLIRGTTNLLTDQDTAESKALLQKIFNDLDGYNITNDVDFSTAYRRLTANLDTCYRVILVGHSQGNFYSNELLSELYSKYTHKDGSSLFDYPMLSYMGIALPTSVAGGPIGTAKPDLIGHITNDNDYIMAAVREAIGAIPANYNASFTFADWTGHGLTEAYLTRSGQASVISSHMKRMVKNLLPPALHGQQQVSSSAINGIGYSKISEILDIEFSDNTVYRYEGVPEGVWESFKAASSKGRYFNMSIKDKYSFTQLQ
ncbi:KTSC domain-containing protein [Vibrio mimicus]|uniref:KTSC domain-containing protein n=1 Tax=Vibrio mimicus TaxID=674 RepID=UPI002F95C227